jgi:hypothetical protein
MCPQQVIEKVGSITDKVGVQLRSPHVQVASWTAKLSG